MSETTTRPRETDGAQGRLTLTERRRLPSCQSPMTTAEHSDDLHRGPGGGAQDLAPGGRRPRGARPRAAAPAWPGSPTTTAGPGCPAGRACSARSTRRWWRSCGGNPVRLLQEASAAALARGRARRASCSARVAALEEARARPTSRARAASGPVTPEHPVAFFCAEYAVHQSLPIYSGGLGALAGDILKEASDRALPLVARRADVPARATSASASTPPAGSRSTGCRPTPSACPAALVTRRGRRAAARSASRSASSDVHAQVWRVDVGRVPLFLLDTELPENDGRAALDRLAPVRRRPRHAPGAVRAARRRRHRGARGAGHRARRRAPQRGPRRVRLAGDGARPRGGRRRASTRRIAEARERTVFTTHTPVPAGNDTYPADQVARHARASSPASSASTPTRSSASAARTPTTATSRSA